MKGEARSAYEPANGSTSEQRLAYSLDEAKEQFKQRYEEMKAQGVRPFA